MLVIMPSNLSLNNLGTLQTRSCSCNYTDCNSAARSGGNACDRDLNRDLRDAAGLAVAGAATGSVLGAFTIPGFMAGGILGLGVAAVNYSDCVDDVAESKCDCIHGHNPSCNCD